ncbi:MAG: hypothetical protein ACKO8Q_01635, partial [Bacteroidota bacterium]
HWQNLLTNDDLPFTVSTSGEKKENTNRKVVNKRMIGALAIAFVVGIFTVALWFNNQSKTVNGAEIHSFSQTDTRLNTPRTNQNEIQAVDAQTAPSSPNSKIKPKKTSSEIESLNKINLDSNLVEYSENENNIGNADLSITQELASISTEDIQAYLLEENSEVLIEAIY